MWPHTVNVSICYFPLLSRNRLLKKQTTVGWNSSRERSEMEWTEPFQTCPSDLLPIRKGISHAHNYTNHTVSCFILGTSQLWKKNVLGGEAGLVFTECLLRFRPCACFCIFSIVKGIRILAEGPGATLHFRVSFLQSTHISLVANNSFWYDGKVLVLDRC